MHHRFIHKASAHAVGQKGLEYIDLMLLQCLSIDMEIILTNVVLVSNGIFFNISMLFSLNYKWTGIGFLFLQKYKWSFIFVEIEV